MSRPRILIAGAGFAGYRTARTPARLTRQKADITLLNPTDHFLYLPLLPQVAAGVSLSGPVAGAVTRGYHLVAMPGNRVRVAADWLLDAVLPRQGVQLGLVQSWSVPLDTASPELARVPDGARRKAPERVPEQSSGRAASQRSAPSEGES